MNLNYLLKALKAALKEIRIIINGINKLQKERQSQKREAETILPAPDHYANVSSQAEELLISIFTTHGHSKQSRDDGIQLVRQAAAESFAKSFPGDDQFLFDYSFSHVAKNAYVKALTRTKTRCDGRAVDQIRPISCEVGLFEPLHGSALFQRGLTQVLCSVALDSPNSVLRSDPISVLTGGLKQKNFMLHYEFPPFATNEVGSQWISQSARTGTWRTG